MCGMVCCNQSAPLTCPFLLMSFDTHKTINSSIQDCFNLIVLTESHADNVDLVPLSASYFTQSFSCAHRRTTKAQYSPWRSASSCGKNEMRFSYRPSSAWDFYRSWLGSPRTANPLLLCWTAVWRKRCVIVLGLWVSGWWVGGLVGWLVKGWVSWCLNGKLIGCLVGW